MFLKNSHGKFLLPAIMAIAILLPSHSQAEIFAQKGYEAGMDGVILLTEKCSGDSYGELKIAVSRSHGKVVEGCYLINNRSNPVVKWKTGDIVELDIREFKKPLERNVEPKSSSGASLEIYDEYESTSGNVSLGARTLALDVNRETFAVEFRVSQQGCFGSMSGIARISGNSLKITPYVKESKEDKCKVSVSFGNSGKTLKIKEESSCLYWHGAECEFSGTLYKSK